MDRLKALYPGFHYRELARILSYKFETRINDKTAKPHSTEFSGGTPSLSQYA